MQLKRQGNLEPKWVELVYRGQQKCQPESPRHLGQG